MTIVKDWYKVRGRADVTDGIKVFPREIHWYQAENISKVESKLIFRNLLTNHNGETMYELQEKATDAAELYVKMRLP